MGAISGDYQETMGETAAHNILEYNTLISIRVLLFRSGPLCTVAPLRREPTMLQVCRWSKLRCSGVQTSTPHITSLNSGVGSLAPRRATGTTYKLL